MIKFLLKIRTLALGLTIVVGSIGGPGWADDAKTCHPWLEAEIDFSNWGHALGANETSMIQDAPEVLPILSRVEHLARQPIDTAHPKQAKEGQLRLARGMEHAANSLDLILQNRGRNSLFPLIPRTYNFIKQEAIATRRKGEAIAAQCPVREDCGIPADYKTVEFMRISFRARLVEKLVSLFAPGVEVNRVVGAPLEVGEIDILYLNGRGWMEVKSLGYMRADGNDEKHILNQADRYLRDRHRANLLMPPEHSIDHISFVFLNPISADFRRKLEAKGVGVTVLAPTVSFSSPGQ